MKSLVSLVGLAVVMGAFGCGTTVNVLGGDDDDGTGGSGEGGAGGHAGTGGAGPGPGPGPTSTSTGPQPPPPNPAECPASSPEYYGECYVSNLACNYLEEQGCTVGYVCVATSDCYEGTTGPTSTTGGYGGYGDCYEYSYWQPTTASCVPAAVDCGVAQDGDVCALPGEYCSGAHDECSYTDKWCGEDHRWEVSEWYDECCYDECCYDDCECDPYYCPSVPPQEGEFCDPCYDAGYCDYSYEDPYCGFSYVEAFCNPDTYTWNVYRDECGETTSVSVSTGSAVTGTGGFDGGGGAGGF